MDKLGEESILQQFQLGIKDALDTHANRLEEQPEVQASWEIIKKLSPEGSRQHDKATF